LFDALDTSNFLLEVMVLTIEFMLIFASIFFLILFGFLGVIILNYAVLLWENKKVDSLTNQIKNNPITDDILQRSNVTRNFTSVDLGSSITKNKAVQTVSNVYDRAIVTIKNQEYPGWLNKFFEEINHFRHNALKSISRFFKYLISLTKPVNKIETEKISEDLEQKKLSEIDELVDKVTATEPKFETQPLHQESTSTIRTLQIPIPQSQPKTQEISQNSLATLDMATNREPKSDKDMSMFEKLEARILDKLKGSGLNHYDIWLELGNLYEKYTEKEKAIEIYALVMKHSAGREKELARDKLIGLT